MVTIDEPERMNLLGLLLASLFERRLGDAAAARSASKIRGDIAIDANGMRVTVRFTAGSIRITRDAPARPVARLRGSLSALLDATLGRNRLRSWARGELAALGSPLALYRLLALVKA